MVIIYKFSWMMQFNHPLPILLTLAPIIYLLSYKGNQGGPHSLIYVFSVVLMPALLGIDYLPSYDPGIFINTSVAMAVGILSPILAFKLVSPSSEWQKAERLVAVVQQTVLKLIQKDRLPEGRHADSMIYDIISHFRLSSDNAAKGYLLRNCVLALGHIHIIQRLKHVESSNQALINIRNDILQRLVTYLTCKAYNQSKEHKKADIQNWIDNQVKRLEKSTERQESIHLATILWQLKCNLPLMEPVDITNIK